ncbi:RNA polymerase sigma factor [Ideonella sp. YS5]|uniref:RNA polymerase sigma factor n=1 Tax=Ideonella sp. YS5 TaxID=3453714 RepID=UPI003EEAF700
MPARMPGVSAPDPFRRQLLEALPRLRRYARTLDFDSHATDDLVQTTIERALTHWHQFDQRRDMRVWLLSIAHNAHLDRLRRDRRLAIVDPAQLAESAVAAEGSFGADPGVQTALRMDLLTALARLSPPHREVLLLAGVEQLSYAECAEVLGVPQGTVMSRLSRARAEMRAALDGNRPGPNAQPGLRRVV